MSKDIVDTDGKVMATMYTEEDVKSNLDNEVVAVIGYGSQGRGQSLNMRDSGVNIILGLIDDPFKGMLTIKDGELYPPGSNGLGWTGLKKINI